MNEMSKARTGAEEEPRMHPFFENEGVGCKAVGNIHPYTLHPWRLLLCNRRLGQ